MTEFEKKELDSQYKFKIPLFILMGFIFILNLGVSILIFLQLKDILRVLELISRLV